MVSADRITPGPKLGRNRHQSQTPPPISNPASAPIRFAPRQKMPPRSAGRNCATPENEISPIAASAVLPPDTR